MCACVCACACVCVCVCVCSHVDVLFGGPKTSTQVGHTPSGEGVCCVCVCVCVCVCGGLCVWVCVYRIPRVIWHLTDGAGLKCFFYGHLITSQTQVTHHWGGHKKRERERERDREGCWNTLRLRSLQGLGSNKNRQAPSRCLHVSVLLVMLTSSVFALLTRLNFTIITLQNRTPLDNIIQKTETRNEHTHIYKHTRTHAHSHTRILTGTIWWSASCLRLILVANRATVSCLPALMRMRLMPHFQVRDRYCKWCVFAS